MPKIVSGFTTCPHCIVTGTPQEPYMALPTDDGRVFCLACQNVTSEIGHQPTPRRVNFTGTLASAIQQLPPSIINVVLSLISMPSAEDVPTYAVTYAGPEAQPDHGPVGSESYSAHTAAACAQQQVQRMMEREDRVEICFTHGPYAFHTLKLSYDASDFAAAEGVEPGVIGEREQAFIDRLPVLEGRALRQLILNGFTPNLDAADVSSSMRHLRAVKGSGGKGIVAQFSWIV